MIVSKDIKKINDIGPTPNQSPKLRLPKQREELGPRLASSILTRKATNIARRLPIHTNKVGGQPNDHWGLDNIPQLKYNQHKHSRISCISHIHTQHS